MTAARRALRAFGAPAAALLLCVGPPAQAGDATVFAAVSLTDVLDAAIDVYIDVYDESGADRPTAVYAATSALARQIEAGAPAALFLSASPDWVSYLEDRGLTVPGSRVEPFGNRLVLAAAAGAAFDPPLASAANFAAALGGGRLALADPSHVPAGVYAKQALRALGLWSTVAARAARTGDVRAALALVERGEAPLAVVYATDLAVCRRCREVAAFPARAHEPIIYTLALVAANESAAATAFHAFLRGERAAAVFRAFGFLVNE